MRERNSLRQNWHSNWHSKLFYTFLFQIQSKCVKTKIRYTPYNQQIGNYNSYRSPMSSPPRTKRDTPPRLPSKKQRSQSLTPIQPGQPMTVYAVSRFANEKYCSADGVIQGKCQALYQILRDFRWTISVCLQQRMGQINHTSGLPKHVAAPMEWFTVATMRHQMAVRMAATSVKRVTGTNRWCHARWASICRIRRRTHDLFHD